MGVGMIAHVVLLALLSRPCSRTPEQKVHDVTVALEGGPDPCWFHFTYQPIPPGPGICLKKRFLRRSEWAVCKVRR